MHLSLIYPNSLNTFEILIRIVLAVVIGCLVGTERQYKNRPAGLRTHVLVCLGACSIALIECLYVAGFDENTSSHVTYNVGRLCAQVISGIGFLGAGTIFVQQKKIAGLTTAASLWNTACMGIACGYGYYWVALFVCVFVLLVLLTLQKIIRVNAVKRVEVRFTHRIETLAFINEFFEQSGIKVLDLDFHIENTEDPTSSDPNVYTNIYTLHLPSKLNYTDVINHLATYPNVQIVRTTNS